MLRYRCEACRVEFEPRRFCPRCGGVLYDVWISANGVEFGQPGNAPRERRRKRNSNAAALVRAAKSPRMLRLGRDEVQAPLFATGTVKGPAGCGKSTCQITRRLSPLTAVDRWSQLHGRRNGLQRSGRLGRPGRIVAAWTSKTAISMGARRHRSGASTTTATVALMT